MVGLNDTDYDTRYGTIGTKGKEFDKEINGRILTNLRVDLPELRNAILRNKQNVESHNSELIEIRNKIDTLIDKLEAAFPQCDFKI